MSHAAFVDFAMPEMSGDTVCQLLTSVDATLSLIGITGTVAADFKVPLFASIEKRGSEVGKVRETAALAVAATCKSRQLRDQAEV